MKLNKKIISTSALLLILGGIYDVDANAGDLTGDKIHFLPTGGSDAILIQSNGKFALVDGGEDSDNPRGLRELDAKGYEDVVVNYIKEVAGDENGDVELEFIVGTHAHSDHLGGLDTVINDPKIKVNRGYIKKYDESKIKQSEVETWDNKEVYNQTINALKKEKAEIIQDISNKPFKFENLTIQFFNTEYYKGKDKIGENENSLGIKITKGKQTVFLAGDINNAIGTEDTIAKEIGKVDVLKLGHHGLSGSSTAGFLNVLKPTYSIVTNLERGMNDGVVKSLKEINSKTYSTVTNDGVVLTFDKEKFGLNQYSSNKEWVCKNNKWYHQNSEGEFSRGWDYVRWNGKVDWYYFDNTGVMKTGWLNEDGKWYYLNKATDSKGAHGAMLTGWQQLNYNGKTNWYYFNEVNDSKGPIGSMLTGWQQLNYGGKTNWYYFNEVTDNKGAHGAMLTGWQKLSYNNKVNWYYFSNAGAMQTGWLNENGKWYYLNKVTDSNGPKGSMLIGVHYLEWNGKYSYYTFNNSGVLM